MADTFGAVSFPVAAAVNPPAAQATGDPLLGWTADFCRAVLTAYCTTAWQALSPSTAIVKNVFLTDPTPEAFNEKDLPALYVYRKQDALLSEQSWEAEDYLFQRSRVVLHWVYPVATQEKRQLRSALSNAIIKALSRSIERNRDPAWVVAGDSDAGASTLGSILSKYAGWTSFSIDSMKRQQISVPMLDGSPRNYPSIAIECLCEELMAQDLADFDAQASLDAKFISPDQGTGLGNIQVEEQVYT